MVDFFFVVSLCSFEVVVCFGSVMQVVYELSVIYLVVSQYIKQLEVLVGVMFFICYGCGVCIMEEGWFYVL